MKTLNVRWRLTLWYGAVLTAIVVGFGATVYAMMHRHLVTRVDFELDEELTELALEVRLAPNIAELKDQLERRFFRHAGFDFQVSGRGQMPLFRSERLEVATLLPEQFARLAKSSPISVVVPGLGEMRVVSRTVAGAGGDYLVQATMPLLPMHNELSAVVTTLLTAGPLAIAAALAGGYLLARRALAPVQQMAAIAEQITCTNLDGRIEVANSDELGQLAKAFNSMLDRLQRSVEELRRFTADAAHELRTPLAVLQMETEIALRSPRAPDEYRRVIQVTLDESKRLAKLVERLLVLSRHDCGLQSMRKEDVPLCQLLADVVEQIRAKAESKNVGVTIQPVPSDEWNIDGDDIQLSQLLYNLVDNAVKFTSSGGQVIISGKKCGGQLLLTISDTGRGISEAELPLVFQRFYRTDKSRNGETGGAGLGLAICQAIAQLHRGNICIASTAGVGTSVQVQLPLAGTAKPSD